MKPTAALVAQAYAALATGRREEIDRYWSADMRWLVPGHHPLAGWYLGLDAFLGFMGQVAAQSGSSFRMENVTTLVNDEYTADVTRNLGTKAGHASDAREPYTALDIDVIHLLRWRDGKVIEGRGAIFGDGTARFDQFWAPVNREGHRELTPREAS
jgi:uncharacterized protein